MSPAQAEDLKNAQDLIARKKIEGWDMLREFIIANAEERSHMGGSNFEWWVTNHVIRTAKEYNSIVEDFEKRWPDNVSEAG